MSHELCHLFGLGHCYYFQCAMNESSSISEAVTLPVSLCLSKLLRMDLKDRFCELLRVSVIFTCVLWDLRGRWGGGGGGVE